MQAGRKTKEWNRDRASLKIEYQDRGITTCEIRLPRCWYDNALSFCHRYKRNDPRCEHTYKGTLLGCIPCHDKLEYDRELSESYFHKLRDIID